MKVIEIGLNKLKTKIKYFQNMILKFSNTYLQLLEFEGVHSKARRLRKQKNWLLVVVLNSNTLSLVFQEWTDYEFAMQRYWKSVQAFQHHYSVSDLKMHSNWHRLDPLMNQNRVEVDLTVYFVAEEPLLN